MKKKVQPSNESHDKEQTLQNLSVAAGAVAGGTAAVGGVMAGGVAGTAGAAALTSGLAATGAIIGGGMLAGIAVVAVAPFAGGILGFGVFRVFRRLGRGY